MDALFASFDLETITSDIDDLIDEYLMFRGFTNTHCQLHEDKEALTFPSPHNIVLLLFEQIQNHQLKKMMILWDMIDFNFFSKLGGDVSKLRLNLFKAYLVTAHKNGNKQAIIEFLEDYGDELLNNDVSWSSWCALPYIGHPEHHTLFSVAFSDEWMHSFKNNVFNFVSSAISSAPPPKIFSFIVHREKEIALQREVAALRSEIESLRQERTLEAASIEVKQQTSSSVQDVTPHSYLDETSPFSDIGRMTFFHSSSITSASFSIDGKCVASGCIDGSVHLWPLNELKIGAHSSNSKSVHSSFRTPSSAPILALEWEPNHEHILLFSSAAGRADIYNTNSHRIVSEIELPDQFPIVRDIVCSPSDTMFITTAIDGMESSSSGVILGWSLATAKIATKLKVESAAPTLCFNHNGNMLAVGTVDGRIRIFDLATAEAFLKWQAHDSPVCSIRFCRDETSLLSVGLDGKIFEWSLHKQKQVLDAFPFLPTISNSIYTKPELVNGDMHFIASNGVRSSAFIYSLQHRLPVQLISDHTDACTSLDWKGNLCLTGSLDNSLVVRMFKHNEQ